MDTHTDQGPAVNDLTDAKGLTLQMPWADLIARSDKRIENRRWRPHRGVTRILIHSGKTWDRQLPAYAREIAHRRGATASAIVAVADIAGVCEASRRSDQLRCDCGRWAAPGQHHWQLANVITFPEPVPCGGSQGMWPVNPAVLDAVTAQLQEVRSA